LGPIPNPQSPRLGVKLKKEIIKIIYKLTKH
jgi:hypothetical protein